MKISAINTMNYYSTNYKTKNLKTKEEPTPQNQPAFKGYFGESAGSALGMLAGVTATFFTGPIAAVIIAGVGCVGGGIAGGAIEDKMNEKKK